MGLSWSEMRESVEDAQRIVKTADLFVGQMARMIVGRLRKSSASASTLCDLKRELADWDMHRKTWREPKK